MSSVATIAIVALVAAVVFLAYRWNELARDLRDARRISELANDPLFVADLVDGRLLFVNATACKLLGWTADEMMEMRLPDLHPKEDVERSAEVIADVVEQKGLVYSDLPFRTKDGKDVDVEVSATVLEFRGAPAVLLHARDIRDRKRLEKEIRTLAQFPETNPFPVMRLNEKADVLYSNPSAKRYMEERGKPDAPIADALPPGFDANIARVLESRKIVILEPYEALGRNLAISYRPLEDTRELFAMIVDETERVMYARELEAKNVEIRNAQAQLVQSEKMAALGNLVAGVAHELNTPIGAVVSNADVAKRAQEVLKAALEDPKVAETLAGNIRVQRALSILEESNGVTKDAAERVSRIVKSLRNFARLDEAERKKVDLHEGLDSTLTLIRHELKKGIEVVKDYGPLPVVDCFPNQLNQVFMNILINACHAIEGGGGKLIVRTRVDGDDALVEIVDNGKGIKPEHLPKIFDPGFTTKGVGVGTGLGLSISYRIIQDHKGSIAATSEVGKGTTFVIRLPVVREPSTSDVSAS